MAQFREHELHGHEAMTAGLHQFFAQRHFSWAPYLFVSAGNRLPDVDGAARARRLTQLRETEADAIASGRIQAVQFRYAGVPVD